MILNWQVDPVLFSLGPLAIRWYSLLFATAFIMGSYWGSRVFREAGKPARDLDRLTIYLIIGTVIGARLGHCLFYDPGYYLSHPLEILQTWKGGLASHGAGIGILLAIYLYSRKRPDQPFLWVVDLATVPIALAGALIRLGNFFNSEIIGIPTGGDWGVVFAWIDTIPRHPAQLYEAVAYLLIGLLLIELYRRGRSQTTPGFMTGCGLVTVFCVRFGLEFLKENQSAFEQGWILNMGQLLSLPLIAVGLLLLVLSHRGVFPPPLAQSLASSMKNRPAKKRR